MRALNIGDQRNRRLCQSGQIGNFTGAIHAHLDHRDAMHEMQLQQHQRHADVIVEIALGRQHCQRRIKTFRQRLSAQDGSGHFLDRGLAVAAGDPDQRQLKLGAPVSGQRTQRQARIGNGDIRKWQRIFFRPRGVDHRRHRAMAGRIQGKIMAVEAFAAQRDK